jgi:hypothetical protein
MRLRGSAVRRTLSLLGFVALAAVMGDACSASGGAGGDDGSGAQGAGTGTGGDNPFDAGFDAAGGEGPCVAEDFPGELVPLDLYIMQDKSASMADESKWSSVTTALTTFINSPQEPGLGVGIGFFPLPPSQPIPQTCVTNPDCGLYGPCMNWLGNKVCAGSLAPDTSCDPLDYDDAEVPIAELTDAQRQLLLGAIAGHDPDGDATPTEPAIQGALAYTVVSALQNPTHLTYLVYATDGEPTGCTYNSVAEAANIAQQAATGAPPVKTFVIGVGSLLSDLNEIASKGGTGQAYLVDTGPNATQAFLDALVEIRANGMCMFTIPMPSQGEPLYDHVNVVLTDPDNPDQKLTIYYVADEAACDPTEGGWYYDDPADPHMIVLCPASCQKVRDTGWNINVAVGCTTIAR